MNVILFGATGMVGQAVLRECLLASDVTAVLAVGRTPLGQRHEKLRELLRKDLFDVAEPEVKGFDACFFCLGVSAAGMNEADYTRLTYELTLAWAQALARANPKMTFVYVSGAGTDSSEKGRAMWARVKGRTENALLALFPAAYMFRLAGLRAMHGEVPKTKWTRIAYAVARPLAPVLQRLFPGSIATTEELGRAMLRVAREGAPARVLESRDLRALGARR